MDAGGEVERRMRVLVIRASFSELGGAERELLTALREWSTRWDVTVATLSLSKDAELLAKNLNVTWITPSEHLKVSTGFMAEITNATSKNAKKKWIQLWNDGQLKQALESTDVVHLSVCRGTLEILPLIPDGLGIHYHCLEPPRWLYEDVLHCRLDGKLKRPRWLTEKIFSKQKKQDLALVKQLLSRPGAAISGNSHYIQENLSKFYDLKNNSELENGEPTTRDSQGRPLNPSVLMHIVDLVDWPLEADKEENEALLKPIPDSDYVITVGRIGWAKGTWETLHSLSGTNLGLVQVGGGDAADKIKLESEAKKLKIPLWIMPRLEQVELRKLIRGAVAMVSHAHGEPFGLTPIEAMAIGVPAIFVDEGGFHWTMKDVDSGLLLPRTEFGISDSTEVNSVWRDAYQQAQNDVNRNNWAKNGRPHVEGKFTLKVQADALERLLRDCIKNA